MTLLLETEARGAEARSAEARGATTPAEAPACFHLAPGVRETLPLPGDRCTVVRLATLDNELLGVPRWASLAEAWCEPGSELAAVWARNPVVAVDEEDDPHLVLATGTPVVVVGVDNAAAGWTRAVVEAVRASCPRVVVVDMGTRPEARYADIATHGHGREHGAALLRLLSAREQRR